MMKFGVIKEGKVPQDKRVPLLPEHINQLLLEYPNVEVVVQSSPIRCYPDNEYLDAGIDISQDVSDCDILLGVKEVPIPELIENKTYLFFSHTIKAQPYNRDLLKEILSKNITLLDYEAFTNSNGARIVAFGRYAGIVGAYNGLLTYGKKLNLFNIRRAHECFDLQDLTTEYSKIKLPTTKIVITGGGRVAGGAMEVLDGVGIRKVSADEFLAQELNEAVYVQLNPLDYNRHRDNVDHPESYFFNNPKEYESNFQRFAEKADLLIASAYWEPAAPVLFTKEDLKKDDFNIKVIADITCDIEGSIPTTIRPTSIDSPWYDYNRTILKEDEAFSSESNITVMSIDNLPNELPRNASQDFGYELVNNVLPLFINGDKDAVLERATITRNGKLTEQYKYLESYVKG